MSFLSVGNRRTLIAFVALGVLLCFILPGCSSPLPPPEMSLAERMNQDLWRIEAHRYAPQEYKGYETTLGKIREDLMVEEARFRWFRDYGPLAAKLKALLQEGEEIRRKVEEGKEAQRVRTTQELSRVEERIKDLDRCSLALNERRLARISLAKAGLMLKEAELSLGRGDYEEAGSRLTKASSYCRTSEEILRPILNRFSDPTLIKKWKRWLDGVIAESREGSTAAIVVSKIERRLTVYKHGRPLQSYEIGLGRNGLLDKLHAGDGATPEGRYRVIEKRTKSQYHKALLLDYPNAEDRKEFLRLKKKGLIPSKAGIGGLIEIHGGGKEGMTYGCVSLENRHMDEVFACISVGTPVAIVGMVSPLKGILLSGQAGHD
jgi:hypothetical protein